MADQTKAGAAAPEPQFVGIGGWLILPAIGFVGGSISGVAGLIVSLALFSERAAAGYGIIYALEFLVFLALLAFLIYTATRFFGKKSDAPVNCVALFILSLVASFMLLVIKLGAGAEVPAIENVAQLFGWIQYFGGMASAAIWIEYFNVSERVKSTFVN